MSAFKAIKADEGFRARPYKCTAGKITIGFGHNLEDNPITIEQGEALLTHDLVKISKEACKLPYYKDLTPPRRAVIINMIYNLGLTGFKKFKRMNSALLEKNYDLAAAEMLDSKWHYSKATAKRSARLAEEMRAG